MKMVKKRDSTGIGRFLLSNNDRKRRNQGTKVQNDEIKIS